MAANARGNKKGDMKPGDIVRVIWRDGGFDADRAVLVDHTDDFRNVTVRTDRGGLMNGMVKHIEKVQDYPLVYPEAKGMKI